MGKDPRSETIIATARGWIGTEYRHQHHAKAIACDCLGLVLGVAIELGYIHNIYESDPELKGYGTEPYGLMVPLFQRYCEEIPVSEFQAGHILLFKIRRETQHCGIATNIGVIHAYQTLPVTEHGLSELWQNRITHAFKFP